MASLQFCPQFEQRLLFLSVGQLLVDELLLCQHDLLRESFHSRPLLCVLVVGGLVVLLHLPVSLCMWLRRGDDLDLFQAADDCPLLAHQRAELAKEVL